MRHVRSGNEVDESSTVTVVCLWHGDTFKVSRALNQLVKELVTSVRGDASPTAERSDSGELTGRG